MSQTKKLSTVAVSAHSSRNLAEDFPSSAQVYRGDGERRVPEREIRLGGGHPPLRVYDTSGPPVRDLRQGLPGLRQPWIERRPDFTQLQYARRGEMTEEMRFV